MQRRLLLRSRLVQAIREVHHDNGFVEVETPNLIKSTPGGRAGLHRPVAGSSPGTVYALPQSPQQLKQLLMVAGIDRYFQIARCFRDEDLRGDRQPEFTQLDLEMSFVDEATVMAFIEHMVIEVTKATTPDRPIRQVPFPVFTYDEAIERFGSDKPDLRFAMELFDLAPALAGGGRDRRLGLPRLRRDARRRRSRQGRSRRRAWASATRREIDEPDGAREAVRGEGPRPPLGPGGRRAPRADREVPVRRTRRRPSASRPAPRGRPGPRRRGRIGRRQRRARPPPRGARRAPRPRRPGRARLLLGPPLPDVPVGRAVQPLGRDPQPVQRRGPRGRGPADDGVRRPGRPFAGRPGRPGPGDAVRRGAQRLGAGRRLRPDLEAGAPRAELQPAGLHAASR